MRPCILLQLCSTTLHQPIGSELAEGTWPISRVDEPMTGGREEPVGAVSAQLGNGYLAGAYRIEGSSTVGGAAEPVWESSLRRRSMERGRRRKRGTGNVEAR